MTTEEFQRLVLEKLESLENGQKNLESGQKNLQERIINLEEGQRNLELGQKNLEERQKSLELGQKGLEKGQKEIIIKLDGVIEQTADLTEFRHETKENFIKIQDYIHELDTKNSDRHFDFTRQIEELKNSVNRIEINTAENWRDIARLKSVR